MTGLERSTRAGTIYVANSAVPVPAKKGEADSLRWLRHDDKAALASGTHLPQHVPTPSSRVRSRMQVAPFAAAAAAPTGPNPSLLTVTVRIDLIEFPPPQPAKKAAGKSRA